jgi:hypothetical protein
MRVINIIIPRMLFGYDNFDFDSHLCLIVNLQKKLNHEYIISCSFDQLPISLYLL